MILKTTPWIGCKNTVTGYQDMIIDQLTIILVRLHQHHINLSSLPPDRELQPVHLHLRRNQSNHEISLGFRQRQEHQSMGESVMSYCNFGCSGSYSNLIN